MTSATEETLESILCNAEGWLVDRHMSKLIFYKDGTGKIFLIGEHVAWIALWFDWKPETGYNPAQIVSTVRNWQKSEALAELSITLTLTKKMISTDEWFRNSEGRVPSVNQLYDSAFLPRTFTMRLEKGGKFLTAADQGGALDPDCAKFAMRMVLEPSPFPAREHWQNPTDGAEQSRFWEIKSLVSRRLSLSEARDRWWDVGALFRRAMGNLA